jgi:hypothetical protein
MNSYSDKVFRAWLTQAQVVIEKIVENQIVTQRKVLLVTQRHDVKSAA